MTRATHSQLTRLIDMLPVYDLQDQPLKSWALAYPIAMPPEEVWFDVCQKIAKFSMSNAITFFQRPTLKFDTTAGREAKHKAVVAQFKARPLTPADLKSYNQRTAAEIAAEQEGIRPPGEWERHGAPVEGNA